MTDHAEAHAGTTKLFTWVWIWLVAITGIEVWMAYIHIQPASLMLTLLLALSVVKAALIISYFMHLRFEKVTLALFLMPALVFCICMMAIFFPDALRILTHRP
jgi:cytochrome c oxidase subunit 4